MREAIADAVHDGDSLAIDGFTHLICFAAGTLLQGLQRLQKGHPVLGDPRGRAIPQEATLEISSSSPFRKGCLLLSCGRSTIRLAPPLVITKEEIEVGLDPKHGMAVTPLDEKV